MAGIIGVPVSAVAYGYIEKLVSLLQGWVFTSLPNKIGFSGTPCWWPLPLLALAGVIVACVIVYLPGTAGPQTGPGIQGWGGFTTGHRIAGEWCWPR